MSEISNIGLRLKTERERLGLSQTVFANLVGAGRKTVYDYESGNTPINAVSLAEWSNHGVDVLFVLTGVRQVKESQTSSYTLNEPPAVYVTSNPRETALLENYRALDDEDKRNVEKTSTALAQLKKTQK